MTPKISILMGIYNCAKTLPEAIDSIRAQTCSDWELILCDDGSSDDTYAVAEEYQRKYPDRIILLKNPGNLGLNRTLNHCFQHASGAYIARMDGDDLSLPDRLEKELGFLEAHPEYAIVSCPMIYFDEHGDWGKGRCVRFPKPMRLLFGTPFCHAPSMVRAEAFREVGGYSEDPRTMRAEDYYLWFCLYAAGYRGVNLPEHLYKMRDDENAYKRRKFKYALNEAYVRVKGYRMLKLPVIGYIFAVRPVLVNLLPGWLYRILHRLRMMPV